MTLYVIYFKGQPLYEVKPNYLDKIRPAYSTKKAAQGQLTVLSKQMCKDEYEFGDDKWYNLNHLQRQVKENEYANAFFSIIEYGPKEMV